MKLSTVSLKILETFKSLQKNLIIMDIMDLCLLPFYCILFNCCLESVIKVLLAEVVLANPTILEPIGV